MPPQDCAADVPKHVVIKNAALGASDQHGGAFIRHLTAAILQAFETNTVKDSLQIRDLLGRQLAEAEPFTEDERRHVREVDSTLPPGEVVERLLRPNGAGV